ncbi:hypothetical protein L195_g055822, partial [Trifolium pratense]
GSTSASNNNVNNSAYSEVINPTFKSSDGKYSRKFPLHSKYIGVQRLDFEDDTQGSSVDVDNNVDHFKSTCYAASEIERIYP